MSFPDYVFYFISAIILISAGTSVFSVKLQSAMKSAAIALSGIAILFFSLCADYIAGLHLLVFIFGGFGIIIFVSLKTDLYKEPLAGGGSVIYVMICAVFAALLTGALVSNKWPESAPERPGLSAGEITGLINSGYMLPLLVTALILFLAILKTSKMRGES